MRNMKKLSFLWILALTSIVSAQELKQPTYIVVGSYKASVGDVDSLKVKIEEQKKNIVLVEYNGLAKIVNTTYATNNLICIKKNKLSDFIEALVYIRDKAIEWNGVLEKRGIEQYEKEFKEVSIPKIDLYVNTKLDCYHLFYKHYIKKVRFVKEGKDSLYKVIFHISGSMNIDAINNWIVSVEDDLEMNNEEINKLIQTLGDATKLCVEDADIDNLLVE